MYQAVAQSPAVSSEAGGSDELVPVSLGALIAGDILTDSGEVVRRTVTVAGQSADELFTYWIGTYDNTLYGYDTYSKMWVPGPVSYQRASLVFQGELIYGWVRTFGEFENYQRFFGEDGVVYERIDVEAQPVVRSYFDEDGNLHGVLDYYYDPQLVYTYYVSTASGERSDSADLLALAAPFPELVKQMRLQYMKEAGAILSQVAQRGATYSQWKIDAHNPPQQLPRLEQLTASQAGPRYVAPEDQPSLLDLIEEELDNLEPESAEAGDEESTGKQSEDTEEPLDGGQGTTPYDRQDGE